jgi:hypothetical protein
VCGTKNFVSARLYSAPQSHWTIVAIFGICAFGEPVQAGSFATIKSDRLPAKQTLQIPGLPRNGCYRLFRTMSGYGTRWDERLAGEVAFLHAMTFGSKDKKFLRPEPEP